MGKPRSEVRAPLGTGCRAPGTRDQPLGAGADEPFGRRLLTHSQLGGTLEPVARDRSSPPPVRFGGAPGARGRIGRQRVVLWVRMAMRGHPPALGGWFTVRAGLSRAGPAPASCPSASSSSLSSGPPAGSGPGAPGWAAEGRRRACLGFGLGLGLGRGPGLRCSSSGATSPAQHGARPASGTWLSTLWGWALRVGHQPLGIRVPPRSSMGCQGGNTSFFLW